MQRRDQKSLLFYFLNPHFSCIFAPDFEIKVKCCNINYMLYVFEGPRNSGKTFLSNYISERFDIQRYQFAFADYFAKLNMESQNSKEAHAFEKLHYH